LQSYLDITAEMQIGNDSKFSFQRLSATSRSLEQACDEGCRSISRATQRASYPPGILGVEQVGAQRARNSARKIWRKCACEIAHDIACDLALVEARAWDKPDRGQQHDEAKCIAVGSLKFLGFRTRSLWADCKPFPRSNHPGFPYRIISDPELLSA